MVFHVQSYVGLSTDVVKSHIDDVESGVGAKAFVKTHKDNLDIATRVESSEGKLRKTTDEKIRNAAAFKLQNRTISSLSLIDDFSDQMPLATVYDPVPQKQ